MYFRAGSLFALSVFASRSFLVGANPAASNIERRSPANYQGDGLPHRQMVAARSARSLERRQLDINNFLKHEHVLPFIDDDASASHPGGSVPGSPPAFAAHVLLKSVLPTLLLEEHEGFIESIACHESIVELDFHNSAVLSAAWAEMQQHPEMLVITSHVGCNPDGERKPYRVSSVEKREHSLVLSVIHASWKQCFHSIDLAFGSHKENAQLKRHDHDLRRRQETATSSVIVGPAISIPPPPTSSPTATVVAAASVTTAWLGTTILPPTFPGSNFLVPDLPAGLNVQCKNCSLQGSINLSDGYLNGAAPSTSDDDDSIGSIFESEVTDIINFFDNGYIELAVNDFTAHIELETHVTPSASLVTYIAPFPDIGIPGWTIPKIATVGPILRPHITFGVQLATTLEFTYGFDLTIPNNSTIHIDINDPIANSTVTGFQNTTFTALPFQAGIDSINLTVSAALNPQILLAFSVFDDSASLAAGAFLDLPQLSATVARVSHVDEHCNPPNASSAEKDLTLLNIVPKVDFDVGLLVDAKLDAEVHTFDVGATTTVASAVQTLGTACLKWDGKKKTFGAAVGAKETGKSSDAAAEMQGKGRLALLAMSVVSAFFMLL